MKKITLFASLFLALILIDTAWASDLNGVWLSVVEGPLAKKDVFMKIQGNTYTTEMNGTVTDSGTCEIASDTLRGVSSNIGNYVYGFKMSDDGKSFTLTMSNGYEVEYKKQ